jgi:hypothetical protein
MAKKVLNWTNVDLDQGFSNKKTAAAYKAWRNAQDAANLERDKLDNWLRQDIAKATGADPDHVVISHRFGLGYAIDETAKPASKGSTGKVKL